MCIRNESTWQILRVLCTAEKTNEWLTGVQRELLAVVQWRKLCCGRVMHKQGNSLKTVIMQGTMPISRARGRPRMT